MTALRNVLVAHATALIALRIDGGLNVYRSAGLLESFLRIISASRPWPLRHHLESRLLAIGCLICFSDCRELSSSSSALRSCLDECLSSIPSIHMLVVELLIFSRSSRQIPFTWRSASRLVHSLRQLLACGVQNKAIVVDIYVWSCRDVQHCRRVVSAVILLLHIPSYQTLCKMSSSREFANMLLLLDHLKELLLILNSLVLYVDTKIVLLVRTSLTRIFRVSPQRTRLL